jgi:hypothetical protein
MPKFAPNTGFKMPGVGSKEIDSPSNFRDEQHVDKVGYCDTTEDSMLPQGSSPLKARYTSSGYLKDLDAISIPSSKKSGCPEGSKLVDGKCVPVGNTKKPPKPEPEKKSKGVIMGVNADYDFGKIKASTDTSVSSKTPGKTTYTPPKRTKEGDEAYANLTPAQRKAQDEKYIRLNTKTTPGKSSSISGKTIL